MRYATIESLIRGLSVTVNTRMSILRKYAQIKQATNDNDNDKMKRPYTITYRENSKPCLPPHAWAELIRRVNINRNSVTLFQRVVNYLFIP